ncbi:uncharacterized protein LOC129288605 isoform X2 [Prosopis cineraria]|uniref:uncharacterized protein LOC129288605 isoform X2 n=1 Tax=Prosopis cineraria TaxID=364024 RepID=UPI0024101981|nr:uncharacterized protein LOC129288605 isoform X2 [Prosopis cineraria]
MASASSLSSTLLLQNSLNFPPQTSRRPLDSSFLFSSEKDYVIVCSAKKKVSFVDQILDYIEGGPKLRKWYGAPDLLPKDGPAAEDEEEYLEDEVRDAVLVTDGDSDMGQSLAGDTSDRRFLKKALRGVRTIICPNEGFLSSVGSLQGVRHIILLSQLSVYRGRSGIQSLMKNNARKLAEQDESILVNSGIPYTIIRAGLLQDTPGGKRGFSFEEGCAARRSLSKEDAAFVCGSLGMCAPIWIHI